MQEILYCKNGYSELDTYIKNNGIKKILLVCDGAIDYLNINEYFNALERSGEADVLRFDSILPNPQYDSVISGVEFFVSSGCDAIFAVGGGSVMDVAKCIKLYSNMDHSKDYLAQNIIPNNVKLLAIPTTAGTGSEATRYAVIYRDGAKLSITHDSIIPSAVLFDTSVLPTLPLYQKKATLMDSVCHAIESFWSVNSNDESRIYSKEALSLISKYWRAYIGGDHCVDEYMLEASYTAGKAINITATTAGHAMCYKLTGLYGISHGHSAGLCVCALWKYMSKHTSNCIDSRGEQYLIDIFGEIAAAMGQHSVQGAIDVLFDMMSCMQLYAPELSDEDDISLLCSSVNAERLKNNPVRLDYTAINEIYREIFGKV